MSKSKSIVSRMIFNTKKFLYIISVLIIFILVGFVSGIDTDTPYGISSEPVLESIAGVQFHRWLGDVLINEFDEDISYKIMEGNFYEFFKRYFEG